MVNDPARIVPADDEPHPLRAFMRLVDAFELTLRNTLPRELNTAERAQVVSITNRLAPGSFVASFVHGDIHEKENIMTGDQYNITGQTGAVGPNAHAHDITFNQAWNQLSGTMDLPSLKGELDLLRQALKREATDPEHDIAIAQVANAEIAAKEGDGAKMLEHLRKTGQWVLSVATKIGVTVAATAINHALGLPSTQG